MKASGGLILIVVALVVLYVALSNKYVCIVNCLECLFGVAPAQTTPGAKPPAGAVPPSSPNQSLPGLPSLPKLNLPRFGPGGTVPFVP